MNDSILLVEDDVDIQFLLSQVINTAGFQVTCKWNGQEALEYLSCTQDLPVLIFLDQQMPVKNGVEFRKDQLKDKRLANIPVIMITADNHISDKLDLSMEIIKKPFDLEAILARIKSQTHRQN